MILLPWPNKALSPNSRTHWSVKSKAVKQARMDGFHAALAAGYGKSSFADYVGRIHVWIDYYAKTRNYPDHDNCLSASKAYIDGIADALGVNDKRFVPHPFVKDETAKGGKVVIRLTRGAE